MSGLRGQVEQAITRALARNHRTVSDRTLHIVARAAAKQVEPMLAKLRAERDAALAELARMGAPGFVFPLSAERGCDVSGQGGARDTNG